MSTAMSCIFALSINIFPFVSPLHPFRTRVAEAFYGNRETREGKANRARNEKHQTVNSLNHSLFFRDR